MNDSVDLVIVFDLDYARSFFRTCKTLSGFINFFIILTQGTFHLTLGYVVKPLRGK